VTATPPLVIDASVVVKWYVPESDSADAARLGRSERRLAAPDLLVSEVGNILWKKVQRDGLPRADAEAAALSLIDSARIRFHRSPLFVRAALEIASTYGRTVYDSLYLALAIYLDTEMVTTDQRLFNSLVGTPLERRVRLLSTF
jgi:predicted nucleic acid-binding protein